MYCDSVPCQYQLFVFIINSRHKVLLYLKKKRGGGYAKKNLTQCAKSSSAEKIERISFFPPILGAVAKILRG